MKTTQISNQVFNVGDYVRTSKGKIGVIEKSSCMEVGYYTNNLLSDGVTIKVSFTCLERFYPEQEEEARQAVEKWQWSYPNKLIHKTLIANQVKLGSKTYPIWSDKLTKLDRLRIRTQQGPCQHMLELPVADAKLLIDIYSRNNIWFAIV